MIYELENKSDVLTGATVIARIPERELDKKALYTIQSDRPEFVLPFHYRSVDNHIEFIYQIGSQCKLQYLSGVRSTKDYISLWSGALKPLLDCGDWFMKPYSFVLNAEYLYYDKNRKAVCYIYIPSVCDCSGPGAIKEMAVDFSSYISVADTGLEHKVLWAIMKDFNPKEFLQMLESSAAVDIPQEIPPPLLEPVAIKMPERAVPKQAVPKQAAPPAPEPIRVEQRENAPRVSGDIIIDIPADGRAVKKAKGGAVNGRDAWSKKEARKTRIIEGLFGGKKDQQQDMPSVIRTAPQPKYEPLYLPAPSGASTYSVPAGLPYPAAHDYEIAKQCAAAPDCIPVDPNEVTESISASANGSRLKLVGSILLPPVIDVNISSGAVFTIGRFDAVEGRRQSNFEFDKKTKAISRRHAAIERNADKYRIVDLASSAGTFLNGQKIPPNTPCDLGQGCRVSFGNAGADYVWEG